MDGISTSCSDEIYTSLRPVVPWIVGDPVNPVNTGPGVQHQSIIKGSGIKPDFPAAGFAFRNVTDDIQKFKFTPLQVNFSDPILIHLESPPWKDRFWAVYPEGRTGQDNDWVSFSLLFLLYSH